MKQGLVPIIIAGAVGLVVGIAVGMMITKPDREKTKADIAEAEAKAEKAQAMAQQQIQSADAEIANLRDALTRVTAELQQSKDELTAKSNVSTHKAASVDSTQTRMYTVKEGDSLWKIAAGQLGNGSRYDEIAKLNADVLKGREDNLTVGMQLKIPAK